MRRESVDEFANRLVDDVERRPEFYFARREIPRLKADLDLFIKELWFHAKMIREAQRGGYWPRNSERCLNPYPCEYRSICFVGVDPKQDPLPGGLTRTTILHPELED